MFVMLLAFMPANKAVAQKSESPTSVKKVATPAQLMADKVTIKKELAEVDSMMLSLELEEESEEYPADDLYGSWNTQHVNVYKDIVVPDSFKVDVTSFIVPFEGRVTSKYGPRRRRFHYGTDVKLQVGDTVRAAFDGKVRVKYYERKGYGYYMVLRHPNGLETVYGHLSKFLVDSDDQVKAGDPIALGGNTGRSYGSHLHFEMRFLGQPINPEEIVDFENSCTRDEFYVFKKNVSGKVGNKYTAQGDGQITYHRVKNGDTLGAIARRYGVTVNQLCRLNNIKSTTTLRIGQSIRCS